jgi:predicted DNA-binding transcriptional regulator YafY
VNGDGKASSRMIRPYACFPAGRHVYVRAYCMESAEERTFRLDRIVEVADPAVA